jgi:hypothetical protein
MQGLIRSKKRTQGARQARAAKKARKEAATAGDSSQLSLNRAESDEESNTDEGSHSDSLLFEDEKVQAALKSCQCPTKELLLLVLGGNANFWLSVPYLLDATSDDTVYPIPPAKLQNLLVKDREITHRWNKTWMARISNYPSLKKSVYAKEQRKKKSGSSSPSSSGSETEPDTDATEEQRIADLEAEMERPATNETALEAQKKRQQLERELAQIECWQLLKMLSSGETKKGSVSVRYRLAVKKDPINQNKYLFFIKNKFIY